MALSGTSLLTLRACEPSGEDPAGEHRVSHRVLVRAGSASVPVGTGRGRGRRGVSEGRAVPVWFASAHCAVRKGVTVQPAPDGDTSATSLARSPGRGRLHPVSSVFAELWKHPVGESSEQSVTSVHL